MANPMDLEFSITKKLLAWGERAAKQGLDLAVDLQPGIDDSDLMRRVVRFIKAAAVTGAPIPDTPSQAKARVIMGRNCGAKGTSGKSGVSRIINGYFGNAGKLACLTGCRYSGWDALGATVTNWARRRGNWWFQLKVHDVCNGNYVKAQSEIIRIELDQGI